MMRFLNSFLRVLKVAKHSRFQCVCVYIRDDLNKTMETEVKSPPLNIPHVNVNYTLFFLHLFKRNPSVLIFNQYIDSEMTLYVGITPPCFIYTHPF